MQITVADEFVDEIVAEELKQTVFRLQNSISSLFGKTKLTKVQEADLSDHLDDLSAARRMYKYFSGKQI